MGSALAAFAFGIGLGCALGTYLVFQPARGHYLFSFGDGEVGPTIMKQHLAAPAMNDEGRIFLL